MSRSLQGSSVQLAPRGSASRPDLEVGLVGTVYRLLPEASTKGIALEGLGSMYNQTSKSTLGSWGVHDL